MVLVVGVAPTSPRLQGRGFPLNYTSVEPLVGVEPTTFSLRKRRTANCATAALRLAEQCSTPEWYRITRRPYVILARPVGYPLLSTHGRSLPILRLLVSPRFGRPPTDFNRVHSHRGEPCRHYTCDLLITSYYKMGTLRDSNPTFGLRPVCTTTLHVHRLAGIEGFEPPTLGFVNRRSVH